MDKVQVSVLENDDGMFTVILVDPNYQDVSIELHCDSQWAANNVYIALIGSVVNVH